MNLNNWCNVSKGLEEFFGNMVGVYFCLLCCDKRVRFNRGISFPKRNLLMKCLWKKQIITIKLSGNVAKSGSVRHTRVDSAFFATK